MLFKLMVGELPLELNSKHYVIASVFEIANCDIVCGFYLSFRVAKVSVFGEQADVTGFLKPHAGDTLIGECPFIYLQVIAVSDEFSVLARSTCTETHVGDDLAQGLELANHVDHG